jgi:hypothetical protein
MDFFNTPLPLDSVQDRFANFDLPEESIDGNSAGLKCEVKTYEARFNVRGERVALQVNTRRGIEENKARDHESRLVVTRWYDKDKALECTDLKVQSPHAKVALRSVIGQYTGVNLHPKRVILCDLQKSFFHYRKELEEYKQTLSNTDASDPILFLLEYMYRTLQTQMLDWSNLMDSPLFPPGLYFENLGMAYRPGAQIYTTLEGGHRVFQLVHMSRCMYPDPHCEKRKWVLRVRYITCDGTNFGYINREFHMNPYEGYNPIQLLSLFPLEYHPEYVTISRAIVERGQKFVSLQGIHHQSYNGLADLMPVARPSHDAINNDM